jgi:surfactin synthase thioesterase subunit
MVPVCKKTLKTLNPNCSVLAQAGRLLAHVLMQGGHGDRPVTLIGYSMGARLVFHCLLELCRHRAKGKLRAAAPAPRL